LCEFAAAPSTISDMPQYGVRLTHAGNTFFLAYL
jgi:hypothetical protein